MDKKQIMSQEYETKIKNQNETLNAFKGIACIFVVFIHARFPGVFGQGVVAIARFAVPLFFMISGYYSYKINTEECINRMPQKMKRTLFLSLKAFAFYFVWESFIRWFGSGIGPVVIYWRNIFCFRTLIEVLIFSNDPLVGHLWFLIALIQGYFLLWVLLSLKIKVHWLVPIILLEINIVLASLSNLYGLNLSLFYTRNVWMVGLPCMLVGFGVHKSQKQIMQHISELKCVLVLGLGVVFTLVERMCIGYAQLYNGSLIICVALFMCALCYSEMFRGTWLAKIGAKYATTVYIIQWAVMEGIDKIRRIIGIDCSLYNWVSPLIVMVVTIVVAWFLEKIQKFINGYLKKKVKSR